MTFTELRAALKKLQFEFKLKEVTDIRSLILEKESRTIIIFRRKEDDIVFMLPFHDFKAKVNPGDLNSIARHLYWRGVVEERSDFYKLLENDRRKQKQPAVAERTAA